MMIRIIAETKGDKNGCISMLWSGITSAKCDYGLYREYISKESEIMGMLASHISITKLIIWYDKPYIMHETKRWFRLYHIKHSFWSNLILH